MKPSKHATDHRYDQLIKVMSEEYQQLHGILVLAVSPHCYELFGCYTVRKHSRGVQAAKLNTDITQWFDTTRHAVTWCTMDYMGNYMAARRVRELDLQLQSDLLERQQQQRRCQRVASLADYIIAANKLRELELRIQRNRSEMDKYITIARQWQTRKLENATKRDELRKSPHGSTRSQRAVRSKTRSRQARSQ